MDGERIISTMDESERNAIRRTIETWRAAEEPLEQERRNRLRAMTDDDVRMAVLDLLSIPNPDLPERGSGLVEQQRAFRRLHEMKAKAG
jgi:hypothetical protein